MSASIPRLILVSTSPYRQELMQRAGLKFRAVAPRFEEVHDLDENPEELALT